MILKNLVFLVFLFIFSIKEINSRRLSRSRNINIPYNIYGRVKCGFYGSPNVKVVLKDNSRYFYPRTLNSTYSKNNGMFTLITEVPYKSQKYLELYFYHKCNAASYQLYSSRKLYRLHLRKGYYWKNKTMNLNVGEIQLVGKRDGHLPDETFFLFPWGRK